MGNHIFIGLDVHARTVRAAALDADTGELRQAGFTAAKDPLINWCLSFPGPASVVYEAGPTGFGLARALSEAGLEVTVAAPSKLPVEPGDRVKTDKRDAIKLARWLAAGIVTPVWIPDVATEAARDLYRCREDIQLAGKAASMRLTHFLLRHDLVWDKTAWTREHMAWLRHQRFDQGQDVFDEYLEIKVESMTRLARVEQLINQEAALPRWAGVVAALKCLRGIDTLTGYGLAVEIGDWQRLAPNSVGAYLGLVPCEYSSGQTRHQGSITKTGNEHVRRLLVEAAWNHARTYRADSPKLVRAFAAVPAPIAARADYANRALKRDWDNFKLRKQRSVVAAIAIARELAGYCRDLAVMTC